MAARDGLGRAALAGVISSLAGVAAMTAAEKLEQLVTGRPSSYGPARTLVHLLRLSGPDPDSWPRNMVRHWSNRLLLGALRGVMAAAILRGRVPR